jgi:hypothetical protein
VSCCPVLLRVWGCRRPVAVGGVGDGETGSVSLYNVGNLNKLDVLFFRPPPPRSATTTQLRALVSTQIDSSRRDERLAHKKLSQKFRGWCAARVFAPRDAFAPRTTSFCTHHRDSFCTRKRRYKRPRLDPHLRQIIEICRSCRFLTRSDVAAASAARLPPPERPPSP